jgi:hypothetical protein
LDWKLSLADMCTYLRFHQRNRRICRTHFCPYARNIHAASGNSKLVAVFLKKNILLEKFKIINHQLTKIWAFCAVDVEWQIALLNIGIVIVEN